MIASEGLACLPKTRFPTSSLPRFLASPLPRFPAYFSIPFAIVCSIMLLVPS
jgi:hypothetical protein